MPLHSKSIQNYIVINIFSYFKKYRNIFLIYFIIILIFLPNKFFQILEFSTFLHLCDKKKKRKNIKNA